MASDSLYDIIKGKLPSRPLKAGKTEEEVLEGALDELLNEITGPGLNLNADFTKRNFFNTYYTRGRGVRNLTITQDKLKDYLLPLMEFIFGEKTVHSNIYYFDSNLLKNGILKSGTLFDKDQVKEVYSQLNNDPIINSMYKSFVKVKDITNKINTYNSLTVTTPSLGTIDTTKIKYDPASDVATQNAINSFITAYNNNLISIETAIDNALKEKRKKLRTYQLLLNNLEKQYNNFMKEVNKVFPGTYTP